MFRRSKRTGHEERELLSVYRDHGVIPKSSRDDNFNRPSEDLSSYQLVQPSDLVINKMKAWQGSIAISGHCGIVSPAYHVYVGSHDNTHRYLHHLFRSVPYISAYQQMSKGIRPNQWDLEPEPFSRIEVLLPSLAEQRAIAGFLDRETAKIDSLVAKKERLIELLQEKTHRPHQPGRHQGPRSRRADEGLMRRVAGRDAGPLGSETATCYCPWLSEWRMGSRAERQQRYRMCASSRFRSGKVPSEHEPANPSFD